MIGHSACVEMGQMMTFLTTHDQPVQYFRSEMMQNNSISYKLSNSVLVEGNGRL
jgi:hypothetical protein